MGLKSFFIKDSEGEKQKTNVETTPSTKPAEQSIPMPQFTPPTTTTTNSIGEVDESGLRHLWEVLAERNLPGPDYLEIRNFAESLRVTGDPVDKRMQSAFLMLRAQNPDFSKDVLLKSVETYKTFINEEKHSGQLQFEAMKKEKIGDREEIISSIQSEIERKLQEIEEIKKEVEAMKGNVETIKQEIQASTSEINSKEQKFNATFDFFVNVLEEDKKIINNLNI